MVRLEISMSFLRIFISIKFTFQYGQIRNTSFCDFVIYTQKIYIPVWLDQKLFYCTLFSNVRKYLHSSMVRLEIIYPVKPSFPSCTFTFQYGQIRNYIIFFQFFLKFQIYIPVWLDQKSVVLYRVQLYPLKFTFQYGQIRNDNFIIWMNFKEDIYIPVWLDQKYRKRLYIYTARKNLHSSMVRLEICNFVSCIVISSRFTFQYGQIRNNIWSAY